MTVPRPSKARARHGPERTRATEAPELQASRGRRCLIQSERAPCVHVVYDPQHCLSWPAASFKLDERASPENLLNSQHCRSAPLFVLGGGHPRTAPTSTAADVGGVPTALRVPAMPGRSLADSDTGSGPTR